MANSSNLRVAVIGGGPGGYAAAFLAADLGMKVTLIDPEVNPGGVCLYRGCIPSKALLHVAKLLEEAEQAKNWGIEFAEPKVDLDKLRGWKEERRQETDRRTWPAVASSARSVRAGQSGVREFDHAESYEDRGRRRRNADLRPHHHRHRIASDRRAQPQTRQPAPDGFDRRARSARHPENAARHRRRLHRTGTRLGLRHARHQGDLR